MARSFLHVSLLLLLLTLTAAAPATLWEAIRGNRSFSVLAGCVRLADDPVLRVRACLPLNQIKSLPSPSGSSPTHTYTHPNEPEPQAVLNNSSAACTLFAPTDAAFNATGSPLPCQDGNATEAAAIVKYLASSQATPLPYLNQVSRRSVSMSPVSIRSIDRSVIDATIQSVPHTALPHAPGRWREQQQQQQQQHGQGCVRVQHQQGRGHAARAAPHPLHQPGARPGVGGHRRRRAVPGALGLGPRAAAGAEREHMGHLPSPSRPEHHGVPHRRGAARAAGGAGGAAGRGGPQRLPHALRPRCVWG